MRGKIKTVVKKTEDIHGAQHAKQECQTQLRKGRKFKFSPNQGSISIVFIYFNEIIIYFM